MWMMACIRPVSPEELSKVVSLSEGIAVSAEVLLELCHSFLVLDNQLSCIRFAHLSVHEVLEKSQLDAHQHILDTIFDFWHVVSSPAEGTDEHPDEPDDSPFFRYAVLFWHDHVQACLDYKRR